MGQYVSVISTEQKKSTPANGMPTKLPQTDSQQEIWASLLDSSMLLALAGMFGLRKKNRQD